MNDSMWYFTCAVVVTFAVMVGLTFGLVALLLGVVWWLCWRPGMVEWIQGRWYLRKTRIQMAEIEYLEEIFHKE